MSNVATGGAIYNKQGIINNITGNFINNFASYKGGAIYNESGFKDAIINIGAVNDNVLFSGNHLSSIHEGAIGGAICNIHEDGIIAYSGKSIVNIYADSGHNITFVGSDDEEIDTDGIYNECILNVNGYTPDSTEENPAPEPITYAGTVNFQNVDGTGITTIYGGKINANAKFAQTDLNIKSGVTFDISATNLNIANDIQNAGTLNLKTGTLNSNVAGNGNVVVLKDQLLKIADTKSVSNVSLTENSTLDLITPTADAISYEKITLGTFSAGDTSKNNHLTFDISNTKNDEIVVTEKASGVIDLTGIRVDGTFDNDKKTVDLFTGSGDKSELTIKQAIVAFDDERKYYAFTQDETNKGQLNILKATDDERPWTIQEVIAAKTYATIPQADPPLIKDVNTYQLSSNLTLDDDLGTLKNYDPTTPRSLIIKGNGNTIDGTNPEGGNFDGIVIGQEKAQKLLIDNVIMKNFDIAVRNDGSEGPIEEASVAAIMNSTIQNSKVGINNSKGGYVTIINSTIKDNETDIINDGNLFFSENESEVSENEVDRITGTGSTNILGGMLTVNSELTQKAVDIKSEAGLLVNADILSIADGITNNGSVRLSDGTLNTDITGTNGIVTVADNKIINNAKIEQSAVVVTSELENNNQITVQIFDNVNSVTNNAIINSNKIYNSNNMINNDTIIANSIENKITGEFTANANSVVQGTLEGGTFNSNGSNTFAGTLRPRDLNLNSEMLNMAGELSAKNTVADGGSLNLADGVIRT